MTNTLTAPATKPAGRGIRRKGPNHANSGYLFVAPFLLLFLLLFLPLGYAAYLSLFREQLVGGTVFVGLDNYTRALTDDRLLGGVLRVADVLRDPGPADAGAGAWPPRSPSTAGCCASRRCSGWASSCPTPSRGGRHADVGLPLRAGLRPVRPARRQAGHVRAALPERGPHAGHPGEHRDLGVHRLQHDHPVRGPARHPARPVRGGGGRRRRRVADRLVHQASRAAARRSCSA